MFIPYKTLWYFASEFPVNLDEMFSNYYIHSDYLACYTYLNTFDIEIVLYGYNFEPSITAHI